MTIRTRDSLAYPYEPDYFGAMMADMLATEVPDMGEPPERKPAPNPWERTCTRMVSRKPGINRGDWCYRGDNTKYRTKK